MQQQLPFKNQARSPMYGVFPHFPQHGQRPFNLFNGLPLRSGQKAVALNRNTGKTPLHQATVQYTDKTHNIMLTLKAAGIPTVISMHTVASQGHIKGFKFAVMKG
ncbi:MAG: hypothetical protein L6357_09725 [Pseudodesulfovibrio aespoeensis]|nr:hypothetical protein [Pseudodesulfovibrio aespoeensis]